MFWKISRLVESPLGDVHAHGMSNGIERFSTLDLPIHIACHKVNGLQTKEYCQEHIHHDFLELNLILPGSDGLTYDIGIDGNHHLIDYPAAIWLPPGVPHAANALEGSGWFICIRSIFRGQPQ